MEYFEGRNKSNGEPETAMCLSSLVLIENFTQFQIIWEESLD